MLIPFSQLSDFVAENLSFLVLGDGEEAYDNCDLIAFVIQISLSIFISFVIIKAAKTLLLAFRT